MTRCAQLIAIILLLGVNFQTLADENKQMQLIPENVIAPNLQFSNGGHSTTLSIFKGKYILVNFWATWCPPCVEEMPTLERLATHLEKNGVVVVAISQDEGGATQVQPFIEQLKIKKIRVLYDPDKRAFRDYALRGLPTTILISPEGKLVARLEGGATWDEGALAEQVIKLTDVKR